MLLKRRELVETPFNMIWYSNEYIENESPSFALTPKTNFQWAHGLKQI